MTKVQSNYRRMALLTFVVLFMPQMANASLIITFVPSNPNPIIAGGTGYVDVLIHSDKDDTLSGFAVDFSLSGGTDLNFADLQSNAYVNDANYVFGTDRLTDTPSSANVGAFTDTILDASTNSGGFVQLDTTDLLLTRLEFVAAPTAASAVYTLALNDLQLFVNDTFEPIAYNSGAIDIDLTGVTSPVPEPSSLLLVMFGLGVSLVFTRKRLCLDQLGSPLPVRL